VSGPRIAANVEAMVGMTTVDIMRATSIPIAVETNGPAA